MEKHYLDKNKTQILHGLAILMMIYHHRFVDGNVWYVNKGTSLFDLFNGINILGKAPTFQMTVAWFCKICVAIFAFTSGYAMYVQLDRRNNNAFKLKELYKYSFRRMLSFYKKFLLCFIFFIGCDILMGNQYHFNYSPINFVLNMLGLRSDYNATWWYIAIYYCMVLISPVVFLLLSGRINRKIITIVLVTIGLGFISYFTYAFVVNDFIHYLKIVSNIIQSAMVIYTTIFIEGMICARYKVFNILSEKVNLVGSTLILLVTCLIRIAIIRMPADSIFDVCLIIPFVFGISFILDKSTLSARIYKYFGKYSTYMWYSHPYFYAYLFYDLVIKSDLSIVVYLQIVFYSLVAAIAFTYVKKGIDNLLNRFIINRQID